MTKHQIAALASKLLGLYFAVHSIVYLSALGSQLSLTSAAGANFNRLFFYCVTIASFALTLGAGLFLFFRAETMAAVLVGPETESEEKPAVRSQNIQVIAFSTVGLVLSLQSVPHLINLILTYWFAREGWLYRSGTSPYTYIDFLSSLLQFALGIWLLFGARGIAIVINRMRGDFQED